MISEEQNHIDMSGALFIQQRKQERIRQKRLEKAKEIALLFLIEFTFMFITWMYLF